jgi:ferredoxin-NADP reductase/Na+-translocating ferredoxin:NAD+ oxidoreductase RnfD subunit
MYRLALYVLFGQLGIAAVLAAFGLLPFSPLALVASTAFLLLMCWAANTVLARAFGVPANIESASITALILALIFDPPKTPDDLVYLGWAAVLAMASKYILSIQRKHIFNPAALAAVIAAFVIGQPASWWVGTPSMLPAMILGGVLLVRKVRQEGMVVSFLIASLLTVGAVSLVLNVPLDRELQQLLAASPLFFFASVMLTEPLTAPPTKGLKRIYGALVGILFVPQIHLGALYSTPELALVAGNVFSYLAGSKQRVVLALKRKVRLSTDIVDFTFAPSQRLAFAPGQYIECTLGHARADSRGNRRYFTIASSPTEDAIHLGVRFYPRGSSFKRALYALDSRIPIIAGPVAGDFTLPADPRRKLAFIAGGVGITPYRSMLKYLLDTGQPRDIVLFYSNRMVNDIIYQDVLGAAQERLGVRVVHTLTDTAALPPGWNGYAGRLDAQMIQEAMPDYRERTFYLSGSPEMVRASERVLKQLGVHAGHIKKDDFAGLV